MTILGMSDDYWIMGGLGAAGAAVLAALPLLSYRLAGRDGLLASGAGIIVQIGWFAIWLSNDTALEVNVADWGSAALGIAYLLVGIWTALFFMGVGSIFLVASPMALFDEVSRPLAAIFTTSAVVFVLLQVAVHKRFGRRALLLTLLFEIAMASVFWSFRIRQPLPIEWGGLYEAMSFSQSILICSLSALTLMVLEKRRRKLNNLAHA